MLYSLIAPPERSRLFVFRRIRQKTNLLTCNLLSANHAIIHFIEYPVKTVSQNLSVCAAIHTACHALHKLHRRLCDLHISEPTTHLKAHMQHTAVSFLKTVFCLKQKPLLYKVKQYPVFPQASHRHRRRTFLPWRYKNFFTQKCFTSYKKFSPFTVGKIFHKENLVTAFARHPLLKLCHVRTLSS